MELNDELVKIGLCDDVLYKLAKDPIISIVFEESKKLYSFNYDASEKYENSGFINKISYSETVEISSLETISLFNNDFQYLSAARIGGKSSFEKSDYEAINQKQVSRYFGQGELAVQYLLHYGADKCLDLLDESDSTLNEQVLKWEQRISPRINFEIYDDKSGHVVIKYGYESKSDSVKYLKGIRAENMGFGISYSLSIIIALLSAKPGALIIIENPEAHLHPQGQAEIATLISLVSQKGVQVIIETHSDHIINGVLVNCKRKEEEGKGIDRGKVAMYFMGDKDENHATITRQIDILENGAIDYQPKGFFDRVEKDYMYLKGF